MARNVTKSRRRGLGKRNSLPNRLVQYMSQGRWYDVHAWLAHRLHVKEFRVDQPPAVVDEKTIEPVLLCAHIAYQVQAFEQAVAFAETYLRWLPQCLEVQQDLVSFYSMAGRFDEAIELFHKVFAEGETWDNHQLMCDIAIGLRESGDKERASEFLGEWLGKVPDHSGLRNVLALSLADRQRWKEAIVHQRRVVECEPDDLSCKVQLGMMLAEDFQWNEAMEMLENVYAPILLEEGFPHLVDMQWYMGYGYFKHGEKEKAISLLLAVIKSTSEVHSAARRAAYYCLAQLFVGLGQLEEAAEIYQSWNEWEPDSPILPHMLAALRGEEVPLRASPACIKALFETTYHDFEERSSRIKGYPVYLESVLKESLGEGEKNLRMLDAGCGIGRSASLLSRYASELIGVDLSKEVLDYSELTGCYNKLIESDLEQLSEKIPEPFDLIVAVESLTYFGDLTSVVGKLFESLKQGGWLVLTLEEGPLMESGYFLKPHGRYVHTPQYLMEILGKNGIRGGSMKRVPLRVEDNAPVMGLLCAVQKPAND